MKLTNKYFKNKRCLILVSKILLKQLASFKFKRIINVSRDIVSYFAKP